MRGIIDRSVEAVVSLLRRLDHLSKGDLGDLGIVADELENGANDDFYTFLNWVKSGNQPPQDFVFQEKNPGNNMIVICNMPLEW